MAIKQRKPGRALLLAFKTGVVNTPATATRYYRYCWAKEVSMFDEPQRELFPIMKVMESFYRTLKVELIYQRKYETRIEARRDIFE
jgi:hypothetical protein